MSSRRSYIAAPMAEESVDGLEGEEAKEVVDGPEGEEAAATHEAEQT